MIEPLMLTVPEAAELLSLSRTLTYQLVLTGELSSVKIGRARRVPVVSLHRFVEEKDEQARTVETGP